MRLTSAEQHTLREASLRWFGVRPRLFGSRTDDARRGGDIDLYIESTLSPQEAFKRETGMAAQLYRELGERKIDIVVNTGQLDLPIYRVARAQGVVL
jgi:predicted nucleotidyltransferase